MVEYIQPHLKACWVAVKYMLVGPGLLDHASHSWIRIFLKAFSCMTGQFHLLSRHFPHSKLSPLWLCHSQEKSFCSYCSQLTLLLLLILCLWGKKKNSLSFINQILLAVKINFVDYCLHLLLLQFVGSWHYYSFFWITYPQRILTMLCIYWSHNQLKFDLD